MSKIRLLAEQYEAIKPFRGDKHLSKPERLLDAIAGAELDPAKDAQDIIAFMDSYRFTDAEQQEITSRYQAQTDQAKREKLETERREYLDQAAQALQQITEAGADPAAYPDELRTIRGYLASAATGHGAGILQPDNRFDFGANSGGIPLPFLANLHIPTPGATIIGAQTGGGKTTCLINIAREILRQGKRAAVISYEMNAQELYLALVMSQAAATRAMDDKPAEADYSAVKGNHDDILTDFFNNLKAHIATKGTSLLPDEFTEADAYMSQKMESGDLAIIDSAGDVAALVDYIEGTSFDAYCIDYLQAIRTGDSAPQDGYRRIAFITEHLRDLVNAGKKTIVLGAQFNRESTDIHGRQNPHNYDPKLEQFREAADIEQLATMAIGSGWMVGKDENRRNYWKILKHRFNGAARDACLLSHPKDSPVYKHYLVLPYSINGDDPQWYFPGKWKALAIKHEWIAPAPKQGKKSSQAKQDAAAGKETAEALTGAFSGKKTVEVE